MVYDRQLLLAGAKRNAVLELSEVQRYGVDSYGDADYVSIYGMAPDDWYSRGIRLLGRTAVECTRDGLGDAIGKDVAAVAAGASQSLPWVVVDLFAGSGNTLYWMLHHLPGTRGIGFELDPGVFELTRQNLSSLALGIDIKNTDYVSGLASVRTLEGQLLIAFIAPPWGSALDKESGLDLRRTEPPIAENRRCLAEYVPKQSLAPRHSGPRDCRRRILVRTAVVLRLVGAACIRAERTRAKSRRFSWRKALESLAGCLRRFITLAVVVLRNMHEHQLANWSWGLHREISIVNENSQVIDCGGERKWELRQRRPQALQLRRA